MKATNKHEFFELLEIELNRIGIEDTADIFADFEEHFSDSAMQGIPEDVTAEKLGDIKEIARSYLNLESSRINSIMARDIEHRKVSLTKPGRGVPADLSLIEGSARDTINSDNIREYTPQHYSGEIYPDNSNRVSINGMNGYASSGAGSGAGFNTSFNTSSNTNYGTSSNTGSNTSSGTGGAAGGAAAASNKSVADAFSDAGRAAVDAAKITGHAMADAFKQSAVKDAVVGAGKTAAEAVKAATHSAADAINKATSKHDAKKQQHANMSAGVPHPTDSYRENMNTTGTAHTDSFRANNTASHKGTIPQQKTKGKPGRVFVFVDTKNLKVNVNTTKLVVAILLDVFLWSWLVPMIFALIIGAFGSFFFHMLDGFFDGFGYNQYHFITNIFRMGMYGSAAVMGVCVGWWFLKLPLRLVCYIINMHIKAVYDL